MILQNLMEEKQLDFSQPLLSVRRSSSTTPLESENKTKSNNSVPKIPPLPVYKSDLKSGPVRNPGTVPFQWERSPGRPKAGETKSPQQSLKQPPIAPKLPPGRTVNTKHQALGRFAETNGSVLSNSQSTSSSDKHVMKHESPKAILEESRSSDSEYDDDDDDAFLDAANTLSRSESFFLDCSISGVSALDGPELQPSGIFSSDPQTRNFMMGRFLPAAKAMASETPPHTTRKQPIAQEQPRPVRKEVPKEKQLMFQQNPNNFRCSQYRRDDRREESEDEDECERPESRVHGVCGLLPHFCLKSSYGLLNPVPGVRKQAQKAVSVRRLHAKYPLSGSYSENENKHARKLGYEETRTGEYQTMEVHEDKIKSQREPNHIAYQTQNVNMSVFRMASPGNEISKSISHEKNEKVESFGASSPNLQTKGSKSFGELLAIEDNRWESASGSPVVEKTLYIDTVHKVKSSETNSSSSDTQEPTDYGGNHSDDLEQFPDMEANPSFDGSVKDEKAELQHKNPGTLNSCVRSSPCRFIHDMRITDDRDHGSHIQDFIGTVSSEMAESKIVELECEMPKKPCIEELLHENDQGILPLARSEAADETKKKADLEIELHKRSNTSRSSNGIHAQRPTPPPLPKAPSDSWLKRTLPTISANNSLPCLSLNSSNFTKIQALKNTTADPKWETIVKTSNEQHGDLRFSREELDPIPEA